MTVITRPMNALFELTKHVSETTCNLEEHWLFLHLPHRAETPDPPPRRVVCDELTPEHGRAERNDGHNQSCHVLATLAGRGKFRGSGEGSEFVDSGSYTGKHHATDEGVHGVGSRANDHANNDEGCSADCNPATADEI